MDPSIYDSVEGDTEEIQRVRKKTNMSDELAKSRIKNPVIESPRTAEMKLVNTTLRLEVAMINKGLITRRNSEPSDVIRLEENPLFKPVGRARAASLSTLMNNMDLVGQDWDSLSSFGWSGTTVETDPSVHTISKNKSVGGCNQAALGGGCNQDARDVKTTQAIRDVEGFNQSISGVGGCNQTAPVEGCNQAALYVETSQAIPGVEGSNQSIPGVDGVNHTAPVEDPVEGLNQAASDVETTQAIPDVEGFNQTIPGVGVNHTATVEAPEEGLNQAASDVETSQAIPGVEGFNQIIPGVGELNQAAPDVEGFNQEKVVERSSQNSDKPTEDGGGKKRQLSPNESTPIGREGKAAALNVSTSDTPIKLSLVEREEFWQKPEGLKEGRNDLRNGKEGRIIKTPRRRLMSEGIFSRMMEQGGDDNNCLKMRQRSSSHSSPLLRRKSKISGKDSPAPDQRLMLNFIRKTKKGTGGKENDSVKEGEKQCVSAGSLVPCS